MYITPFSKNIFENKNDAGNVTPGNWDGKEEDAHRNVEYESNIEVFERTK